MSETARDKLANFMRYRSEVHYPSDVVVLGVGYSDALTYGDLRALQRELAELRAHPESGTAEDYERYLSALREAFGEDMGDGAEETLTCEIQRLKRLAEQAVAMRQFFGRDVLAPGRRRRNGVSACAPLSRQDDAGAGTLDPTVAAGRVHCAIAGAGNKRGGLMEQRQDDWYWTRFHEGPWRPELVRWHKGLPLVNGHEVFMLNLGPRIPSAEELKALEADRALEGEWLDWVIKHTAYHGLHLVDGVWTCCVRTTDHPESHYHGKTFREAIDAAIQAG